MKNTSSFKTEVRGRGHGKEAADEKHRNIRSSLCSVHDNTFCPYPHKPPPSTVIWLPRGSGPQGGPDQRTKHTIHATKPRTGCTPRGLNAS
ncbi:hypothetical protein PBY51_015397 [Eleginops maclovinus]|uniref:Uncharacterized protein n=1 Tax=Eleginops maclovinus TaxID=56733 RepID=A0AAN7X497_ELEMC|nr:hypothetical protein PBY51_015397 [Eleginops maclovinus]